jgi:ABC-type Fe3+/spermidine/putrescine transport system ATPase subunit
VTSPDGDGTLTGRITKVQYLGDRTEFRVDTPAGVMTVIETSAADRRVGDSVGLNVAPHDVKFVAPA